MWPRPDVELCRTDSQVACPENPDPDSPSADCRPGRSTHRTIRVAMPDINTHWRTDRPEEGFHTTLLESHPGRPVRTYLPADYLPKYPYPLVVLFHAHGSNEERAAKLAPRLSHRNYICISLRGPQELAPRSDGRP